MLRPIDTSFFAVPATYLLVITLALFVLLLTRKLFFTDIKNQSIYTIAPLIGNTGNLGIPLAIVFFGEIGAVYTNAINLANVFFVYTLGVFFYSRGEFSIKRSLQNIFKIPIMWVALVAIILNISGVTLSDSLSQTLQMGAYASMTIQLILFGVYLEGLRLVNFSKKLVGLTVFNKFILLPAIGFVVVTVLDLSPIASKLILLELIVPLALTNATLATLYNCNSKEVTANVVVTSLLFIPIVALFLSL